MTFDKYSSWGGNLDRGLTLEQLNPKLRATYEALPVGGSAVFWTEGTADVVGPRLDNVMTTPNGVDVVTRRS